MRAFFVTLLFSLFVFSSCTQDETCREKTAVLLRAEFYGFNSANKINIDSITVFGLQQDSLYKNVKNINKIALPLNNSEEQSIFVMNLNGTHDTLRVSYTNADYFISYSCGMIITHKIDTVITTNHVIKNLKIVNRDINTADVQHLQIFF